MRMVAVRPAAVLALVAALWLLPPPAAAAETARQLRARASDLTYNLDYAEAAALLRQAIALDPADPANHRALASSLWLDILFQRGAVTVDHYLGSFSRSNVTLPPPPAALDAEFRREAARAVELSEARVSAAPKDAGAHLDLGTSLGLQASYIASVDGKLLAGFRAARRAFDECEQALALDPARHEPQLVVGTYRYIVSTLSLPMRWMAYVAGFGGGRERGMKMIEDTAASTAENRTEAQFALVLLYNRERRYADALRVLADLRARYPRNRLVLLEAGATAARAGQAAQAEAVLTEGIRMMDADRRPRIPGERALWHYKRGAARVALKRAADAGADLTIALAADSLPWVRGRAHLERARLALQHGDRAAARQSVDRAIAECEAGRDPVCVSEARKIR
jgi:tetratricopeptide (TPR) repeat protein